MVIILMKSGREIKTSHNWDELKGIINENINDDEMVVQEVLSPSNSVWTSVKKSEIEAYRNI